MLQQLLRAFRSYPTHSPMVPPGYPGACTLASFNNSNKMAQPQAQPLPSLPAAAWPRSVNRTALTVNTNKFAGRDPPATAAAAPTPMERSLLARLSFKTVGPPMACPPVSNSSPPTPHPPPILTPARGPSYEGPRRPIRAYDWYSPVRLRPLKANWSWTIASPWLPRRLPFSLKPAWASPPRPPTGARRGPVEGSPWIEAQIRPFLRPSWSNTRIKVGLPTMPWAQASFEKPLIFTKVANCLDFLGLWPFWGALLTLMSCKNKFAAEILSYFCEPCSYF